MPLEFDIPESRWSLDDWRHRSPSPRHPRGVRPEQLRAVVIEAVVRGHVVNGRMVQADSGRRYLAVVPGDQRPGDRISFQVVADPAHGSRLEAAVNVVAIVE